MTTREIVDKYMAHHGFVRIKGDSIEPILPMLMLDIVFNIYNKLVRDTDCKHLAKRAKNAWRKSYKEFNLDFFRCYDTDESIQVTDKMDDFEKYVHNDVVILKLAIINAMPKDEPIQVRNTVAAAMTCNILAQAAQFIWGKNYRISHTHGEVNFSIQGLVNATYNFANEYHKSKDRLNINLNESEEVNKAWNNLSARIIKYVKYEKQTTSNQQEE